MKEHYFVNWKLPIFWVMIFGHSESLQWQVLLFNLHHRCCVLFTNKRWWPVYSLVVVAVLLKLVNLYNISFHLFMTDFYDMFFMLYVQQRWRCCDTQKKKSIIISGWWSHCSKENIKNLKLGKQWLVTTIQNCVQCRKQGETTRDDMLPQCQPLTGFSSY